MQFHRALLDNILLNVIQFLLTLFVKELSKTKLPSSTFFTFLITNITRFVTHGILTVFKKLT